MNYICNLTLRLADYKTGHFLSRRSCDNFLLVQHKMAKARHRFNMHVQLQDNLYPAPVSLSVRGKHASNAHNAASALERAGTGTAGAH